MFKLVFITCICVMSFSISGLVNGKPTSKIQREKASEIPNIKISKAIVSSKQLIELVQYAMRMMVSKKNNVIDEAAVNSKEFFRGRDSPFTQSTTPKIIQSKNRRTFESVKRDERKAVEKKQEKLESLDRIDPTEIDSEKINSDKNTRLAIDKNMNLKIVEPILNRNDDEILANFMLSEIEKIPNNQLLPLAKVGKVSSSEEKDLLSSKIRLKNVTIKRVSSSELENEKMYLPFEAIITFTRQKSSSLPELENPNIEIIPTRDPPDDFPPYFETILSLKKRTTDSKSDQLNSNPLKILNRTENTVNKINDDEKNERQTPKVGEAIEFFDFTKHGIKESQNDGINDTKSQDLRSSDKKNNDGFISVKFDENNTDAELQINQTLFQRQEFEDEDDEEEEGSLGSITGVLPLVLPILEDLSNPNTDTDIAELLEAGLPLVQGLSQPNGENDGIDLVGIVTPIIASLSGPSRRGNGTVLQSILPLIIPLITPFIGPIVGPIIQGLSNPADQGGSSITSLIQAVAGPLSLPATPVGISPAASLISGVIASLSKDLKAGSKQGGSDIGALVSTLISGVIAGGSAGLSAGFMKPVVQPPRQNGYGYGRHGQAPVPASSVNPLDLLKSSAKEIIRLSLQLIKSIASSSTEILGSSSSEKGKPIYGPPSNKSYM